jgi:predicted nucleic acid-binding protein
MQRVYLDSNMVIYFVERHPKYFQPLLQRIVDQSGREQVICVTSDLVRLESRLLPLRQGPPELLTLYDEFFRNTDSSGVRFDRDVFDLATQMRAEHRLKTPDALHLAAALRSGCDEFWTHDHRLAQAAQNHIQIVTFGGNS